MTLPDVQKSTHGFRQIPIQKVGMRNVELPLTIYHNKLQSPIQVKGTFSSYCNLVSEVKGINMSRITRTLIDVIEKNDYSFEEDFFTMMKDFSFKLKAAHGTDDIYTKVYFDYPLFLRSPHTDLSSPEYFRVGLDTTLKGDDFKKYLHINRVGMSLCPCSREMSLLTHNITDEESTLLKQLPSSLLSKIEKAGFGAHNQRSHVDITLDVNAFNLLDLEALVSCIDKCFSCPTKTVLKREDEKYETEVSYAGGFFNEKKEFIEVEGSGAKFVEDIARDVAFQLETHFMKPNIIQDYVVVVNNDESIHSGDILATAVLTAGKNLS